jgi:hypothetical protein
MPLAGTICCQTGEPRCFAACEQASREGTCRHALPILVAMRNAGERRKNANLSVTMLASCPREVILAAHNDYYEDPEDYYARWQGMLVHYAAEIDGPYEGVVQEVRFVRGLKVDGVAMTLSGQPDWIDTQTAQIHDFKATGWSPTTPKQDHVAQLNCYRWLLGGGVLEGDNPLPPGFAVDELVLHYSHPLDKVTHSRHSTFRMRPWDDAAVERYIRRQLAPYVRYEQTGSLAGIGVAGVLDQEWRKGYCTFRHACNPGQCCLAKR